MFDELRSLLPLAASSRDGLLHIGDVSITELADAYGTPVIAYDAQHVRASALAWIECFAAEDLDASIAYATKAFSSVGMLRLLGELGLGADVSSLGELQVALVAGIDPARIVLHGNNKSRELLATAVHAKVGIVVVDAESELELLARIADEAGVVQPMLVRINPDVHVETHRYINTAHAGSKFGVAPDRAESMLVRATGCASLDPRGVHVHLGSQLVSTAPWGEVLAWLAGWAKRLRSDHGIDVQTLDVGGGLGIRYTPEQSPPTPRDVAAAVRRALDEHWIAAGLPMPALIVEPGRSIVGQAALTIYTTGVIKDAGDIRYVNVDGGMSDNPRPTLYGASYRALLGERCMDAPDSRWWIAGVHCESGDVLIEDAELPHPIEGELLVVPATGAYAASMSSTYNCVPRCAVVLIDGDQHRPLVRREQLADLLTRDVDAP